MAGEQNPPPAAAATAAAAPTGSSPASAAPSPNPNLAYLNPIDRTAYTKNVVQSHTGPHSSASAAHTAAANQSLSAASSAVVFNPALLAAPTFDPHTFITTTLSQPSSAASPTAGSSAPPTLQSLQTSLTAYSSTLHASLVALLNNQYESFITLSSSLLPLPPLLSTLEDYAEHVREKSRALLLVLSDKRDEEAGKRREWLLEEERERWLGELNDCVERVRMAQAVMAEVDEAAEAERIASGAVAEGEDEWVSALEDGQRAVVRQALRASSDGAGSEEMKRREERRQKRVSSRPAPAPTAADSVVDDDDDEDVDDEEDDAGADEAVKRQHNQAYDLFLSLLSSPAAATNAAAADPSSTTQPSPSSAQLYRLTHLTFLFISLRASMTLMAQFQLVSSLQSTVASLYASFLSHLQRAFLHAVSNPTADPDTLTSVLRLYVLLDERTTCESVVREQLLVPALHSIFAPGALRTNPSASSSGGAVSNLGALYERVLELVERVVCVLDEATRAFSPRSFDWFGDVFFAALAAQLTPLASALFSPGTPSVFHAHYTLSCSLLSTLSALHAASSGGVVSAAQAQQQLLSHPAVDAFLKRWSLSIYFMLRFQQLATAVETACSLPVEQQQASGKSGDGGSGGWRVAAVSGVVESSALQCWADGVWLAELSGQFLKLTLQCVERYCSMLEAGCKLQPASGASAASATTTDGSTAPAAAAADVVCAFPAELLYAYHDDVQRMDSFIAQRMSPAILARLPAGSHSSLTASLSPTIARLRSLPPLLLDSLTALLSSAATVPLSAVAGLRQQYRMSKKGPTAPSPYVAQLLATLAKQRSTSDRAELLRLVVARVCEVWGERVQAVMDVALKMEVSLRLLKKSNRDAAGGEQSEVEKIRGQLELDVREFERGLRDELGVAVAEVQPLQQLQRLIHTVGVSG